MSETKREITRKPNVLVYGIIGGLLVLYGRIKWRFRYRGVKPKGPAIVISNHNSNIDWITEGGLTWPRPMTFMVTYHFFTFRFIGFLLRNFARAVPKYQFATDLASIRKIKSVLHDSKGLVFIAPEGTVYGSGKLGYISPAICKMIRMMNVPVYASRIEGDGLGVAKWSKRLHRARINVTTTLLFTQETIKSLSINEMLGKIRSFLDYDDFEYQKREGVSCRDKDKAEGLDNMLFICPCCNREFTTKTEGNRIFCTECSTEAVMQDNYRFKWSTEKQYFDNYSQWYDWQLDRMREFVSEPDFRMEEVVDYGIDIPGVNNYKRVGHGVISLSRDGWDYNGTFNGEQIHEHDDLRMVPLATYKMGKHFELPYRFGHCRVFYPELGKHAMKWHLVSRAISELLAERDV